jgi:hypothetical protein
MISMATFNYALPKWALYTAFPQVTEECIMTDLAAVASICGLAFLKIA